MKAFIYIDTTAKASTRLEAMIRTVVPSNRLKVLRTPEHLFTHLSRPQTGNNVIILLTSSQDELSRMLEMSPLFDDHKLILILPDDSAESINKGCRLFPRYMDTIQSDFSNVAAVVEKMQTKHHIIGKKLPLIDLAVASRDAVGDKQYAAVKKGQE